MSYVNKKIIANKTATIIFGATAQSCFRSKCENAKLSNQCINSLHEI
jgi:hypothetical protein